MERNAKSLGNLKYPAGAKSTGVHLQFTGREQQILRLIAEGMTNREIAEHLTLSPTTVKWYVKQIFNKLGANHRTQAVKMAADRHIIVESASSNYDPVPKIPAPLTALFGREQEVSEISSLLQDPAVRLVSILGVGGIGKTRLALEVACRQGQAMPGQVCFVTLDSVVSLRGLIQAIASAIGFHFHGSLANERQLLAQLRNRKLILVLDNFEHLLEFSTFIHEMLAAAPRLKVLTTSRERLNLRLETVYLLQGLDYPPTANRSQDYASFILFMQIARYSQPAYQPDSDDVFHICRICQLVEGMPLAIELAAKWVNMLTPAQIEAEIEKGISILQTSWQDLPNRHHSIYALFERSWQLLSSEDQNIFKKLCVFRGGFDSAAARQVAGATLFTLSTLIDKSLLMRVRRDRFKFHELVRQFVEEKLQADPEEYTLALHRHCQYFGDLMAGHEKKIKSNASAISESLWEIHDDYANIFAGWHHALEAALLTELGKYVFTMSALFQSRGLNSEAERTFAHALRLLDAGSLPESDLTRVR
jgi:predicted ATPase/DNA-binding CsgD family transcriptional regulator